MSNALLKPAPTCTPQHTFRWCDRKDEYMPAEACKKRGEQKRSCKVCYQKWNRGRLQLELPIKVDTDCRGVGRK